LKKFEEAKKVEWRKIPSYPEYQVSERGDVRRVQRRPDGKGKCDVVLKFETIKGKFRIRMFNTVTGTNRRVFVHRLVAEAFLGIGICDPVKVVTYDGDKRNLHYLNLKRGSESEAMQTCLRTNSQYRAHVGKITAEDAQTIRRIREHFGRTFREIGEMYGLDLSHVRRIVTGQSWPMAA